MWVIDIRHWLDETQTGAAAQRLKFKVKKLSEIITYATCVAAGIPVDQTPKCRRRLARKTCQGDLDIRLDQNAGHISWRCPVCEDQGVISGWRGLIWDMSEHPERWC
jgi:hypothetical protein